MTIATVTVLVFGVSSAAAVVSRLNNVHRVDIAGLVPTIASSAKASSPSDASAGQPVNILLIGSDARNGENAAIGGQVGGERSDTAIVMHVSADRSRVELVSIPRDSIVTIPSCTMTNGKTSRARTDLFNSAFATGWDMGGDIASAAACSMNAVQVNTGLRIDHFVVVDFAGFQKMVDAVGGVDICVTTAIDDPKYTGYKETVGLHHMGGVEALDYARVRYGIGDASDIQRIKRQQQMLGALAHMALSKNVLTNAPQLLTFATAVTSSLTMDSGLSLSAITGLAYTMRGVSGASIEFMTIPTATAPSNRAKVVWTSAAAPVWLALIDDTALVPKATATPSGTTSAAPTVTAPSGVTSVQDVQNQSATACAA